MPFDAATLRVLIDLIDRFVHGFDDRRFADDTRTLYAVIHCLEIISEASRRLTDALKQRHGWRRQRLPA